MAEREPEEVAVHSSRGAAAEEEQSERPTEQPPLLPPPVKKGRGKGKQAEEEGAWRAVSEYYTAKRAVTPVSAQSSPSSSAMAVDDEDDTFCRMLSQELRKIKMPAIKRQTKRLLLETVYAAQEQEEQQGVQVIQWPTVLPAAPVGLPVPSTEAGQVVIQLQQQGIPTGTVATSEAELLLQLQQQPYQ